jgi:trk system potassium uptake protein TrkA
MKRNKNSRIAVIGLGRFGSSLAKAMARQCDVLAIDSDIQRVNAISDDVHLARCLDARNLEALSAVISPAFGTVVVSIARELEASILCTLHLKHIGVTNIMAKAHNDDHAEILRAVGATSIVSPEQEHAERVAMRLLHPNLLDYLPVSRDYRVTEVTAPARFYDNTLVQLNVRQSFGVFIMAVKRGDSEFLFLPGPEFVVQPNDVLVVIGKEDAIIGIAEA